MTGNDIFMQKKTQKERRIETWMRCDFFRVTTAYVKNGVEAVIPEFLVKTKINDLMIRGGKFYAILNKRTSMWETNEGVVQKFDLSLPDLIRQSHVDMTPQDYRVEPDNDVF